MKKLALFLITLIIAGQQAHAESRKTYTNQYQHTGKSITIATEGAYPPFNFTNADGSLGGFEIELGNALCAEIQAKCQFVTQDWDGIMPALLAKKYDVIMAGMSITEERQQHLDFSLPYYLYSYEFIGNKSQSFDESVIDKIANNRIAVQSSSVASYKLSNITTAIIESSKIQETATVEQALDLLKAGKVDLVFMDSYLKSDWLKENPNFESKSTPIYDVEAGLGIAFRKESSLKADFNKALLKLQKSGEYKRIYHRYF